MDDLRLTMIQSDIVWENRDANLCKQEKRLKELKNKTDLIIFPEMFTTGFSMNSASLADTENGETICRLKYWADKYGFALSGSFICVQNNQYFNRGFFIAPGNNPVYYNKRHLFQMGNENQHFSPGSQQVIAIYKGWNICLSICYDLRFPVWLRNNGVRYDLLLVPACWPQPRISAWDILLQARAIENQTYVCGVNRVGKDPTGLYYPGHSAVIDPKGKVLLSAPEGTESVATVTLSANELIKFRQKFPVLQDADSFTIHV
ncbi:nitrilase family protein [Coprobacter sp.]